jgi:RNA polymerase sigma factor (sigma-70 family)
MHPKYGRAMTINKIPAGSRFVTLMQERDDSKTSLTLLGRLAVFPPDQAAWAGFVDRYGPRILKWCRAWRLQEADVFDVSQVVLTRLSVRLRQFEYDPGRSFRGFLRKLVHDALKDALAARGRGGRQNASEEPLANLQARDDLVRRLEEEFDLELLEAASRIVQSRVAEKTWEAYRLTTSEGLSGAEAAARVGLSVAAVFMAKSTVKGMLQEKIRALESGLAASESR